jgi:predicted adenylyl cyclase CyaB
MPSNVEIKARLRDPEQVATAVDRLAAMAPEVIHQHDTFYRSAVGRLKLRRFPDGTGELIAYHRPDLPGPKTSSYRLYRTGDPAALDAVLSAALGRAGDVRKERRLFLVGRTRVHLDRVEGLGDFLELEVVLAAEEGPAAGEREARALMATLGVPESDLVTGAYVDLLAAEGGGG